MEKGRSEREVSVQRVEQGSQGPQRLTRGTSR